MIGSGGTTDRLPCGRAHRGGLGSGLVVLQSINRDLCRVVGGQIRDGAKTSGFQNDQLDGYNRLST